MLHDICKENDIINFWSIPLNILAGAGTIIGTHLKLRSWAKIDNFFGYTYEQKKSDSFFKRFFPPYLVFSAERWTISFSWEL